MASQKSESDYPAPYISPITFILIVLGLAGGMFAAMLIFPAWVPNIVSSLVGPAPKAFWYLSRSSAFLAFNLLWLSMVMGLLLTTKVARSWPGAAVAFAVHEFVSLLGVIFSIFHAFILLGDKFIDFSLNGLIIPFRSTYLPFWVGLGQIGFFGMLLVSLSYYLRKRIGNKSWRLIHYINFLIYPASLFHGLMAGSDTSLQGVQLFYWSTGAILVFLVILRIVNAVSDWLLPKEVQGSRKSV